jgi:hypothetical protein
VDGISHLPINTHGRIIIRVLILGRVYEIKQRSKTLDFRNLKNMGSRLRATR